MNTLDDIVRAAKRQLAKDGSLQPTILIEGTSGSQALPLPELAEALKLSVLEALGYTYAQEHRIGELQQLFLIAEGWRSKRTGSHSALQPQFDPDRVECVMVFHYLAAPETRRMILYDLIRNQRGEVAELKAHPLPQNETVESPTLDALMRGFTRGRV